ncbi:Chromosome transmission fidelity protein 18 [Galdieria sulphuraria]|nr:Chromosome transmission fidelity protein 18 [Galdieria sulphuraria]
MDAVGTTLSKRFAEIFQSQTKVGNNKKRIMDSHNKLWVDKHHPNRITELLGDATVQRQLLHTFIVGFQLERFTTLGRKQEYFNRLGPSWHREDCGHTHAVAARGFSGALYYCLFASQLPPCIVLDDVVFAAGQVTNVDKCIKILSDNAKGGVNSTGALKNSVWVVIICEDAYSRGLATLRPFAKIVHFGQSDTKSLLFRSMRVLTNERNEANGHDISQQERDFLKYLCEAAAGDIRWVLNQLQFVQNHFQYLPVSFQQFDDFKDLSRSNMIDIMNSIFECQNKEQQIYYRYFCGLSVAEYDSLLDICPTIAMTAFYVANLSRPLSYEIESVVKDIDAHFREKRLEQQRMRTNIAALQELRNSWMSSFARFDKTQQTAETYPRLTSLIYHSIKNASKLTEIKQRIEAIQKIAKIFRCYGISVTWESKDLLEEDEMETQLTHHKSWNFVPTLPQLSYFEDMSPWQTETQSFMETLSILIGILENPESEVEHLASQKERDSWLTVDSNASTTNGDERTATHVCFRFHEGHSNAILKPVTIDMFSC